MLNNGNHERKNIYQGIADKVMRDVDDQQKISEKVRSVFPKTIWNEDAKRASLTTARFGMVRSLLAEAMGMIEMVQQLSMNQLSEYHQRGKLPPLRITLKDLQPEQQDVVDILKALGLPDEYFVEPDAGPGIIVP